jgi:hypothetical protein
MKKPVSRAGRQDDRCRKPRRRVVPKWLSQSQELNAIARSRCLLILSVLSGEKPVTQAIKEAGVQRQTYYNLEAKALKAMLAALSPLSADDGRPKRSETTRRIAQLEQQVEKLSQDKRRAERMLLMTRKSIHFAVALPHGRPAKDRSSIPSGKNRSLLSKMKAAVSGPSTPTTAGAAAS